MDRRTRAFIVVGLAVVLAGAASFGVFRAIQNRPVVRVPIAERFTVVAAGTIPVGTVLTPELVRVAAWPADAPIAGGFAKPEEVVGRGVTVGLVENEPIVESKLAQKGQGGGLSPLITPGMRALSVRVNDVINVAGWVLSGSRVDVIVTIKPGQETLSRTVLSNVQVIGAGPDIDPQKSREGKAINTNIVTLLLTPADGEKLTLAMNQGSITLALRNPLDMAATETTGVRVSSLVGAPNPEPVKAVVHGVTRVVPPPAPPPPPKPPTVEVIVGTKKTQEIIKK